MSAADVITDSVGIPWRCGPSGELEAHMNGAWRDDHGLTLTRERVRLLAPLTETDCGPTERCGVCDACVRLSIETHWYETGYADGDQHGPTVRALRAASASLSTPDSCPADAPGALA